MLDYSAPTSSPTFGSQSLVQPRPSAMKAQHHALTCACSGALRSSHQRRRTEIVLCIQLSFVVLSWSLWLDKWWTFKWYLAFSGEYSRSYKFSCAKFYCLYKLHLILFSFAKKIYKECFKQWRITNMRKDSFCKERKMQSAKRLSFLSAYGAGTRFSKL